MASVWQLREDSPSSGSIDAGGAAGGALEAAVAAGGLVAWSVDCARWSAALTDAGGGGGNSSLRFVLLVRHHGRQRVQPFGALAMRRGGAACRGCSKEANQRLILFCDLISVGIEKPDSPTSISSRSRWNQSLYLYLSATSVLNIRIPSKIPEQRPTAPGSQCFSR